MMVKLTKREFELVVESLTAAQSRAWALLVQPLSKGSRDSVRKRKDRIEKLMTKLSNQTEVTK